MRFLVFGSLNLDFVYTLDHIVAPGETETAMGISTFPGGKGLNQAIALARAGAEVHFAGMTGPDGGMLLDVLSQDGVDTTRIRRLPDPSGQALIQLSKAGENSIILFPGTNRMMTPEYITAALFGFGPGDMLLLQNEINGLPEIIATAHAQGMRIALNPSPMDDHLAACDLSKVDLFFINEVEGRQITGEDTPDAILQAMRTRFPAAAVVLTLGGDGVRYADAEQTFAHPAYSVPLVDTTAAGDTFTGFFLATLSREGSPGAALRAASVAAALAVSRMGASISIPTVAEVAAADITPRT